MSVRAKFKLVSKKDIFIGQDKTQTNLEFSPVYSDDPNSENRKFWEYTPSGKIELNVINPDAVKLFELGKEYYIDFIPT